ncbi:MAG TPA: hypothetical protein VJV03_02860 [Pyrinomonadaceae bacterium]|nr:hypothetical protein [Pyrinomonadaceae bacterium]
MAQSWQPRDTSTHQDHVIAHVVGATVLGYWVCDEVLYLLLDIGFVWIVFLDGQMTLLPHPVALSELDAAEDVRDAIKADIDLLLGDNGEAEKLSHVKPPPLHCQSDACRITSVEFFESGDDRRLLVHGQHASVNIQLSILNAQILVDEYRR